MTSAQVIPRMTATLPYLLAQVCLYRQLIWDTSEQVAATLDITDPANGPPCSTGRHHGPKK